MPEVGFRLRTRREVTVVAFGSSSTAGIGASSPATTYPSRLQVLLNERFPGGRIHVINAGVSGESTPDMMKRLQAEAINQRPNLVIWQTGSNDILRGTDPAQFAAMVRSGIALMQRAGIEVMLMDQQYSPRLAASPNASAYVQLLRGIAAELDVPLIDRFDAMRYWAESGTLSAAELLSVDQLHMTDASYECLAEFVSGKIAQSASPSLVLTGLNDRID